jgi:hemolysin activation/secretion protein
MAAVLLAPASVCSAQSGRLAPADEVVIGARATAADGPAYTVGRFDIAYGQTNPDLPPIEVFESLQVRLGEVASGYVAPREGVPTVTLRLDEVPYLSRQVFYASAIGRIDAAIVEHLQGRELLAVFAQPDPEDIHPETGEDLRDADRTTLRLVVWVGMVRELRTLAVGERIDAEHRVNHPAHRRIREYSPIRPPGEGAADADDLLYEPVLTDYLARLNRHPGRKVEASVASAGETGSVTLDYLVREDKPWLAYFQVLNTGTESTGEWRQRFGFIHNQLTGHDDILRVDYITSGFDETQALTASYEAPLWPAGRPGRPNWLRWRVYGSWSEFTADDIGVRNVTFSGESWKLGGEVLATVYQRGQLFVDAAAGAYWQNIRVNNELLRLEGETRFFLPYLGVRLERETPIARTNVSLDWEWTCPAVADPDDAEVAKLGRFNSESQWSRLRWNATHSFYLEPVLRPAAWRDPTTPETSTLAHELELAFRGQTTCSDRLIPQHEQVVGGLYTVRGYEESAAAGDTALIGTVEYRFHLPAVLGIEAEPGEMPLLGRPFRWRPQHVYGRADWDLIFRGFFDAGRTLIEDRLNTEAHETLMGCGLGVELQFTRHMNLRCDWAVALEDLEGGGGDAGDNRVHVVATFLY